MLVSATELPCQRRTEYTFSSSFSSSSSFHVCETKIFRDKKSMKNGDKNEEEDKEKKTSTMCFACDANDLLVYANLLRLLKRHRC